MPNANIKIELDINIYFFIILMASVDKIIEQIWLGDKDSAKSKDFIKDNKITIVINCSKNIKNYFEKDSNIEYYRVMVNDKLEDVDVVDMRGQIFSVIFYMYQKYQQGHNILVHCRKGKQRSATVVTAFLSLLHPDKNISDLMEIVREKRSIVFNKGRSVNFIDVLTDVIV